MSGLIRIRKMNISDMIIELHNLAREVGKNNFDEGIEIRYLADALAKIGNKLHEKESPNAYNEY
jgi:hypothetical protein